MLKDAQQARAGQNSGQTPEAPGSRALANTEMAPGHRDSSGVPTPSHPAVTMLCFYYYPQAGGGADRLMQRVAERLAGAGWPMTVLTQAIPGVPNREAVNGVQVRRLPILSLPGLRFFSYMASAFWQQLFQARLKRGGAAPVSRPAGVGQVLHLNQMYLHVLLAIWLRRLRGPRVVVRVACGGPHGELARLRGLPLGLGRWVLRAARRADAVISLTNQITEELCLAGFRRERIWQIANGVDAGRFAPADTDQRVDLRQQLEWPPDQPVVLFAGRLEAQKGADVLLRAWKTVQARQPQALLVLAGDGSQRAALEALSQELGIAASVRFLGQRDTMLPLYQAADLFVLPSWSEGMSNALLEAMACGLAPVATAIPGNTDVVTDESDGLLVTPGDAAHLATALARLLEDTALRARLAAAARQTILARFALEQTARQYAELYQYLTQRAEKK
jgi:glycosyltransferase involved in cell wall biosynthesis